MKKIAKLFKVLFGFGGGDHLRVFSQARVIKKELPLKIKSLCELGCGTAGPLYSFELIKRLANYTGIDGFKPNIETAKQRHADKKNVNFILADAADLSAVKSAQFDIIVSTEVIEHVADDDKMLMEMHRILKDNGKIFISTPLIYRKKPDVGKKSDYKIDFNKYEEHKVEGYLENELIDKLNNAGYKVENKLYCFYFPVRFGMYIIQKIKVFKSILVFLSFLDLIFAKLKLGKPYDIIIIAGKKY